MKKLQGQFPAPPQGRTPVGTGSARTRRNVKPINEARIDWLRLTIPQLQAGGFTRLAAQYGVELARLEARR